MTPGVALVTGGARGIGKAIVRAILEAGGKVSFLDVLADKGKETEEELLKEFGAGCVLFIQCDVTDKQQIEDAYKRTKDTFGGLDLVVNNAGILTRDNNWRRTIEVNLVAYIQSCMIAVDYMSSAKGGKGGHIVNIASIGGLYPERGDVAYMTAKHGIVGLSRSMAIDYAKVLIRVNCLCPGYTDTELSASFKVLHPEELQALREMHRKMPKQSPSDVAVAFKQLLLDAKLTGTVMTVTPEEGVKVVYTSESK